MIGLQFNDIFYVVGTIYLAFILISVEISVVSYIVICICPFIFHIQW